jgi:Zn-dependent peptidase ImmA (M78 family)
VISNDADEDERLMSNPVPYLSDEAIERDAAALLAEYAHARGTVIAPPIPIEDIVEKHLKLSVDFDDLHKVLGVPQSGTEPDIFGAIWFDRREIFIDQSLDPEDYPTKEGRYRFTLAHEGGGHWRLHRHLFAKDPMQAALLGGSAASVVCRSSQAKERVEWQADFYASCLLMPRKLVMQAWRNRFGNLRPFVFAWERSSWFNPCLQIDGQEVTEKNVHVLADFDFREIAQPFAYRFNVSVQAMCIRLEKLELLLRAEPQQRTLSDFV